MGWAEGTELDVRTPNDHVKETRPIVVDQKRMKDERAVHVDISAGGDQLKSGRETLMVNASIMSVRYEPVQGPWLVDMDLESASNG
jgi:hypothetical protein